MIITPEERYYVEPASRYSKAAKVTDYVMYKESDVIADSTGWCGVTMSEEVNHKAEGLKLPGISTPCGQEQVTAVQAAQVASECWCSRK